MTSGNDFGAHSVFGAHEETDPVRRAQTMMRPELPKRFYDRAEASTADAGFSITLDGRPVRTPGGKLLTVADSRIAAAIAGEWDAQEDRIDPDRMPLTRLLNSALDGVDPAREAVADDIAGYAETDLLCYRASGPDGLVERQKEIWDPILGWAERELGARFILAEGVMPVAQAPEAIGAVKALLPRDEALPLTALHSMTTLTGSVLIALAVYRDRLTVDDAWTAAHVDEDWNIQLWGADAEAMRRRERREREMRAAAFVATTRS